VTRRHLGVDYLRGFVVVQVVAFHSVVAYIAVGSAYQDVPVIFDARHAWGGFVFLFLFCDVYFMSLLFFISGLFVGPSLARQGAGGFARARVRRRGLPLILGVALLMPPTCYAYFLLAGTKLDLLSYWIGFFFQPIWPTGPFWFLIVLLPFELAAAALFRFMPQALDRLGRSTASAGGHPARFFMVLSICVVAAYLPLLMIFGPSWVVIGPSWLQASRLLLYGVYFFAGVAVGANGIDRGLLAGDGGLVRRWPWWVLAAATAHLLYLGSLASLVPATMRVSPVLATFVYVVVYVATCSSTSFAFLAVFQRFARRNSVWDSLAANSFGIYVVHVFFVFWAQYVLFDVDLSGIAKGTLVFASALGLSWLSSALFRGLARLFERDPRTQSGGAALRGLAPHPIPGPGDGGERANG